MFFVVLRLSCNIICLDVFHILSTGFVHQHIDLWYFIFFLQGFVHQHTDLCSGDMVFGVSVSFFFLLVTVMNGSLVSSSGVSYAFGVDVSSLRFVLSFVVFFVVFLVFVFHRLMTVLHLLFVVIVGLVVFHRFVIVFHLLMVCPVSWACFTQVRSKLKIYLNYNGIFVSSYLWFILSITLFKPRRIFWGRYFHLG